MLTQLTKDSVLLNEGFLNEDSLSKLRGVRRDPSDKKWRIPNPVNPRENFADKWNDEGSKKAEAFFQWVKWAEQDLLQGLETFNEPAIKSLLGESVVSKALDQYHKSGAETPRVTMIDTPVLTRPNKPWMK